MKKVILCALVLAVNGVLVNSVLAQERVVPRYLVTYTRSFAAGPIRAATAVTVTNQSSESCSVLVEWFRGAPATTSPLCIQQELDIGAHQAFQFCSRSLPGITNCNPVATPATCPALFGSEGTAIVFSSDRSACRLLGVEARVYYTTPADAAISAISNSKIVFFGEGNLGD